MARLWPICTTSTIWCEPTHWRQYLIVPDCFYARMQNERYSWFFILSPVQINVCSIPSQVHVFAVLCSFGSTLLPSSVLPFAMRCWVDNEHERYCLWWRGWGPVLSSSFHQVKFLVSSSFSSVQISEVGVLPLYAGIHWQVCGCCSSLTCWGSFLQYAFAWPGAERHLVNQFFHFNTRIVVTLSPTRCYKIHDTHILYGGNSSLVDTKFSCVTESIMSPLSLAWATRHFFLHTFKPIQAYILQMLRSLGHMELLKKRCWCRCSRTTATRLCLWITKTCSGSVNFENYSQVMHFPRPWVGMPSHPFYENSGEGICPFREENQETYREMYL